MVVTAGETEKSAPLAEPPIEDPPEATVYQAIVFPEEVAFNAATPPPGQTVLGVAVAALGAVAKGFTVTETAVLEGLTQPPGLFASA